jgi:hypothetical protein
MRITSYINDYVYFSVCHNWNSLISQTNITHSSLLVVPSWSSIELLPCDVLEASPFHLLHIMYSKHQTPNLLDVLRGAMPILKAAVNLMTLRTVRASVYKWDTRIWWPVSTWAMRWKSSSSVVIVASITSRTKFPFRDGHHLSSVEMCTSFYKIRLWEVVKGSRTRTQRPVKRHAPSEALSFPEQLNGPVGGSRTETLISGGLT